MSHHHTYYVTSSYILCHIIIHTMSHTKSTFSLVEFSLGAPHWLQKRSVECQEHRGSYSAVASEFLVWVWAWHLPLGAPGHGSSSRLSPCPPAPMYHTTMRRILWCICLCWICVAIRRIVWYRWCICVIPSMLYIRHPVCHHVRQHLHTIEQSGILYLQQQKTNTNNAAAIWLPRLMPSPLYIKPFTSITSNRVTCIKRIHDEQWNTYWFDTIIRNWQGPCLPQPSRFLPQTFRCLGSYPRHSNLYQLNQHV